MYYMVNYLTADFGIGNITGTRYFLGDISKEGKDSLIKLNKARKQWALKNANAQAAYGDIGDISKGFTGSVSRHPSGKRFGSDGVSDANLSMLHDTTHAIPMALGRPGMGFGPNDTGELLVRSLEEHTNRLGNGLSSGQAMKPYKVHQSTLYGSEPEFFTYRNKDYANINGYLQNSDVQPKQSVLKARTRYMKGILRDIDNTPGMNEALDANKYLTSRKETIKNQIGNARVSKTAPVTSLPAKSGFLENLKQRFTR